MRAGPGVRRLAFAVLLLSATSARADAVRFDARVSTPNITLDQTVELTISIEREGTQAFEGYRPPAVIDFDVLHTGSSQQMQWGMAGGRQAVRMVEQHNYVLRPKKKGALSIGPATARIAGQELHTRAITVHVAPVPKNARSTVAPPGTPGGASSAAPPAPPSGNLRGDEELFLDVRADKLKAYVGEQITVAWRLYTRSEILKYRNLAEPKHADFWSENLFVPSGHLSWDRQVVDGREYAVAQLMKKGLFPLKAGKLVVSPLEAEVTTLQTAFYSNASDVRRSRALTLEILPLPVAGRPAGFDPANVGRFELEGEVDRTHLKAGEAASWKLTLRGVGNLRNVKLPPLGDRLPGFKVYEPAIRDNVAPGPSDELRGERVFTFLLMPKQGGALTIPALELAYFDPAAGTYGVARTAPVELTVEGEPARVGEAPEGASQDNVLGPQIRPIRNKGAVHSAIGERLWRGRGAVLLVLAPPGMWLSVLIGDLLRRRLQRDTPGTKRRRARRAARARLRKAEYHLKVQRPSAFFAECVRVLYEHLEYRLGTKVESLTLGELRAHLAGRGFPSETAEAVVQELETCDFARFASSASGPGEMRAALRRVRTLLGWIEKAKLMSDKEQAA